ncbi:MAG: hypothetical protein JJV93_01505 [Alphaproteobacteria bacterium]|nr:hypothetical protein [Alphaproteobacteria bacterium]
MVLSWNEIKSRAVTFQNEWKDEKRERGENLNYIIDRFWCGGHCYALLDIKECLDFLFQILKRNQKNISR